VCIKKSVNTQNLDEMQQGVIFFGFMMYKS